MNFSTYDNAKSKRRKNFLRFVRHFSQKELSFTTLSFLVLALFSFVLGFLFIISHFSHQALSREGMTPEQLFKQNLHRPGTAQFADTHVYSRTDPKHLRSLLPGLTKLHRLSNAPLLHGPELNHTFDLVKELSAAAFFESNKVHEYEYPHTPFIDESVKEYKLRIRPRMDFSKTEFRKNTIFVSVPSYRDDLCTPTIRDLFDKAEHPELLFVGVCDQYAPGEDKPCEAPKEWAHHVKFIRMDYRNSTGPTFARYLISKLWDGEEFFFSIDSHTGFMYRWDSVLVDMMRHLPAYSLVSHYPVADVKSNLLGITEGHLPWLCKGHFQVNGLVKQECGECHKWNHPNEYTCTSVSLGAGFYFGYSEMLYVAPFDRYLDWLFQGEELLLSARLWTGGWEFFSPPTNVVHHVYGYRKHSVFSEGHQRDRNLKAKRMFKRVFYLLEAKNEFPEGNDMEMEDLGMGSVRSLREYFEFSGINMTTRTWTNRCFSYYDYQKKQWMPQQK